MNTRTSLPFSKKVHVENVVHLGIDRIDVDILWDLVHNTHKHENLVTFTTTVEKALSARKSQRNMLVVACTTAASHGALGVDSRQS